jgi:hypothetical protein
MGNAAAFADIPFLVDGAIHAPGFVPFPQPQAAYPTGWSSGLELVLLYNFGRVVRGPLLEIGPWIGRSTCALAMGMRDGGAAKAPPFDVVDFGITSVAEWEALLGVSFDGYIRQEQVVRAIHAPGGSMAMLTENLRAQGLLPYVTSLIRGNALEVPLRAQYDFIFCDTLHDRREVELYGPLIEKHLAPGGYVVCDDVFSPEHLGAALLEFVSLESLVYLNPLDKHAKMAFGRKRGR